MWVTTISLSKLAHFVTKSCSTPEDGNNRYPLNLDKFPPDYTASHLRRLFVNHKPSAAVFSLYAVPWVWYNESHTIRCDCLRARGSTFIRSKVTRNKSKAVNCITKLPLGEEGKHANFLCSLKHHCRSKRR